MRVRLIRRDTIEEFAENHTNGEEHFMEWLEVIKYVDWEEPKDIASSLSGNLLGGGSRRVVFDVGGEMAEMLIK